MLDLLGQFAIVGERAFQMLARFERDVLTQAGVKYVILGLGINDILFPAFPFTPSSESVSAEDIVAGYRQLIARAHRKGIRVIATTGEAATPDLARRLADIAPDKVTLQGTPQQGDASGAFRTFVAPITR